MGISASASMSRRHEVGREGDFGKYAEVMRILTYGSIYQQSVENLLRPQDRGKIKKHPAEQWTSVSHSPTSSSVFAATSAQYVFTYKFFSQKYK